MQQRAADPFVGQLGDAGRGELDRLEPLSLSCPQELVLVYSNHQEAGAVLIAGQCDMPAAGGAVAVDLDVGIGDAVQPKRL